MLSRSRWESDAARSKKIIFILAASGFLLLLFGWRLSNLTAGLSPSETATRTDIQSLSTIRTSPLNAPLKLLDLGLVSIGHASRLWLHLGSAILAIVFISCFYTISKIWFGRFVAVASTIIFATTPWLIINGRVAAYNVLLLWPVVIWANFLWLKRSVDNQILPLFCLALATALGLYVPGMVWFLILGLFFSRRYLKELVLSQQVMVRFLTLIIFLLILAPLLAAIIGHPNLLRNLLLIPSSWPSFSEIVKSTAWSVLSLVWRTRQHLSVSVGHLAMLNLIQILLAIFGIYALSLKARRTLYGLLCAIILAVVLASINQSPSLIILALPPLSLIVAAGLRYLYLQWQQVFPKNPLPRALALTLICLTVGLSALYGIRYAFLAWPHTLETRNTYVLK